MVYGQSYYCPKCGKYVQPIIVERGAEKPDVTKIMDDLSTDEYFQFRFTCEKCGAAYKTPPKKYDKPSEFAAGAIRFGADLVGDIVGSIIGDKVEEKVGYGVGYKIGYEADEAAESIGESIAKERGGEWDKQHETAKKEAIKWAEGFFKLCPRCHSIVDPKCWDPGKGMCKDCAKEH